MPGVRAILTADDMPAVAAADGALPPEVALTNEPVYQGEPILAVAAIDEWTAADAIDAIDVDLEPLPFVVDPLASLRAGGPNARLQGNAFVNGKVTTVKWADEVFAAAPDGALPAGDSGTSWTYGDVEAGFRDAALVLDETFHTPATGHEPLETRSAMAYWQNGRLYLHGSTQSLAQTVESVARWVGVDQAQVVIVSEYTGGGFGSKIPGAHSMAIPALLAKKANAPVMMRISREEEHYIGRTRPNLIGRAKVGFGKDGRVLAVDLFVVQDAGPYEDQYDVISDREGAGQNNRRALHGSRR
jgi:CO/xanthine dehydrogenase Mo-binding subunit